MIDLNSFGESGTRLTHQEAIFLSLNLNLKVIKRKTIEISTEYILFL